jgi:Protein of unknown function (DUF3759)
VTGQPGSHDEAKKIMAGFAGAFVDREVEPRAENAFDRERVQRDALQQAQPMLDQQYGQQYGQQYDQQNDQQYNQ